jgi:hypothetical protein
MFGRGLLGARTFFHMPQSIGIRHYGSLTKRRAIMTVAT